MHDRTRREDRHLKFYELWDNLIVQRKALTPNDFDSLDALAERLLRFAEHYRHAHGSLNRAWR